MTVHDDSPLAFLALNERPGKPRAVGITEVRGPFYSTIGPHAVEDLLAVAGDSIDWFKIPAPALGLLPKSTLRRILELCHDSSVKISAGGLIERVVLLGPKAVDSYFDAIRDNGFDIVEVSAGMLAISTTDYLRLIERAKATGLTVKAEVGIQFGAGGGSAADALEREGTITPGWAVRRAKDALAAGADLIILESEGVTESVTTWRSDVPALLVAELGIEKVMFEAADPRVFEWYIKNYGPEVNLFVDHSQALHLESLRSGIWGSSSLFGRIVTYKG